MAQQRLQLVAYMLLDHVDGQTEGKRRFFRRSRPEIVSFLQGELVIREPPQKQPFLSNWIAVQAYSSRGRYAVVPKGVLAPLTNTQLHLLCALPYDSDRYAAYQNKHLNEAEQYITHSKVIVTLPNFPEHTPGIIWYAGPVETLGNGTMFGVELLADPPRGNCDGTFHSLEYFTCPSDCGIFLPFDKLRLCLSDKEFAKKVADFCTKSDKPSKRLRSLTQSKQPPQGRMTRSQTTSDKESDAAESRLQIGMPVVVFQDGGGHFKGHVRWLGDVYRQQTHKVKGQPLTTLMAVAGIEMDSKQELVVGLEGMESQEHAHFNTQHGGQKVYFPVDTVMPLEEYTGSIHSAPHTVEDGEQAGTQQELTGGSNSACKEDIACQRESKWTDDASVQRHQAMVLKKLQDSCSQQEPTAGRIDMQVGTDRRHSQYDSAGVQFPETSCGDTLDIGSAVEVKGTRPLYGVIRWIGEVETLRRRDQVKVFGIELDNRIDGGTDGTFLGERHFKCRDGCGWFVSAQHCVPDTRFEHQEGEQSASTDMTASMTKRSSEVKGEVEVTSSGYQEQQFDLEHIQRDHLSVTAKDHDQLKAQLSEMLIETRELRSALLPAEQTYKTELDQWKEQVAKLIKERDDFQEQIVDETRENLRFRLAWQTHLQELQRNMEQLQDDKEQLQYDKERLEQETGKIQRQMLQLQLQNDKQQAAGAEQEDKQKLLRDKQQLEENYHLQSEQLAELQQCYSTLQSAHKRCLTQPQQLQSINIPATDVCLLGTKLGGGSYGAVFKAMWRGIQVAVKIFHEELRVSEYNKKLFRQELDNCAALRHPNIVTFCGATLENDNPLQIVTELLEGSLDELIKAAISCDSYLTHLEQVHLAEGTTAGITFLHQRQPTPFVHCDIRPANILVTRDMSAKVADLGGSHIIGASTSAGPLSINYTAPERIGDRGPRSLSSPSSDVYSLGVTLTELFTGNAAIRSEKDQQLTMIGSMKLQSMCIEATSDRADKRPTAAKLLTKLQAQKEEQSKKSCHVRRLVIGKVEEGDAVRIVAI